MRNEFEVAFSEIAELRALPREVVLEALQNALVSAYRRHFDASNAQHIEARIDPDTGRIRIFAEKEVVDEVQLPDTEVDLETARFYDPEAQIGDLVMVQVQIPTKQFGRIAAQNAKQVILQKIREAERAALFEEFSEREGDLMTGTVQSISQGTVIVSLGRAEGRMPRQHQIPGERYRQHDKLRVYVYEVKRANRGPEITVSRSHRNMLRRLLEYEVPEIYNGQVEIKNIAREAGYRSKVAVAALQDGIDPVGACVGMRGIRIQNIVKELNDEKIDVIEWNPDQEVFISKALSPARVTGVYLDDDPDAGRTAIVLVPDDQLSLAIGREGQNARLAAKLTGWRIDIKSVSEAVQDALSMLDVPPLNALHETHGDMIEQVRTIMAKREANRAVMPEEFNILGRFADIAERTLLDARLAERAARMEEINAVRATLPAAAFSIPISVLDLPDDMIEALESFGTVGEIMLRFLIDEESIRRRLENFPEGSLERLQQALDAVVVAIDIDESVEELLPEEAEVGEEVGALVDTDETEAPEVAIEEEEEESFAELMASEPEIVPDVFGEPVYEEEEPTSSAPKKSEAELDIDFDDDFDDDIDRVSKSGKKKKKKKRRDLIYDEDSGKMVARRRRKGSRRRGEWDDDFEF
ncbi:MAG: transcription termination/antitermination protein NusA [Chloroflexi bacterium]|nr:MAG: transcription termination/antitermination protein NusA [Chloroflexota bacterium]